MQERKPPGLGLNSVKTDLESPEMDLVNQGKLRPAMIRYVLVEMLPRIPM